MTFVCPQLDDCSEYVFIVFFSVQWPSQLVFIGFEDGINEFF